MDSDIGKTIVGYEMTELICFFTSEGGYKFFEPDIPHDDFGDSLGVSLNDITQQIKSRFGDCGTITVISEFGLSGKIYLFGNHGDFWEEHGKTKGYA